MSFNEAGVGFVMRLYKKDENDYVTTISATMETYLTSSRWRRSVEYPLSYLKVEQWISTSNEAKWNGPDRVLFRSYN